MRTCYLFIFLLLGKLSFSQGIKEKLDLVINKLAADEQFRHSIISLYVVNGKTGIPVYDKSGEAGLAPASCQKIITSASAFELLGKNYHYRTNIYIGKEDTNMAILYFQGYGDPTLGSSRYASTKEPVFMDQLKLKLDAAGIKNISSIYMINPGFSSQTIPDGWVWQDVGNYFGAGSSGINWRENQYDIILSSGAQVGDPVSIKEMIPAYTGLTFNNECKTGAKKSGDNAYIYLGLDPGKGYIRGSIPAGENNFSISGAVPDPSAFFSAAVHAFLEKNDLNGKANMPFDTSMKKRTLLYAYDSPSLDSMNYWFLKKSINLYGEAFVKTIAYERMKAGSTDSGVKVIKDFWSSRGIERSALKIIDGSGLSPANRITTNVLVQVLQYAKKQSWFSSFYNALPEMNGIRMKDGYISGVRSYAGYVRSAAGAEYSFAFIVNNFDGDPAAAREKIWKILDLLK